MPVNVLFLHSGDAWIRGSENALLALLGGLDRSRVEPFLISSNTGLIKLASAEGIRAEFQLMPQIMIEGGEVRLQALQWVRTVRRLRSFIRTGDIRLVYCNGASTCQVGYYAARLARIPAFCHLHSPYNRRHILLYRFHRASRVIFASKAIETSIRAKQHFAAQCHVVYYGVNTDRFRPASERDETWRERLSLSADGFVFGQVSSLIPRKGVDVLLRAFQTVNRRHPEARLALVGDGPQREDYVALTNRLGIAEKVVFAGEQLDPLPFYQHVFDVNVLASRQDALPLTLLEAAACGLPSIGAAVDGIPEAVLDNETGLLFESENEQMLADKMSLLMDAPALRRKLGEAARRTATERFAMRSYCRSIERLILEQVGPALAPRSR